MFSFHLLQMACATACKTISLAGQAELRVPTPQVLIMTGDRYIDSLITAVAPNILHIVCAFTA